MEVLNYENTVKKEGLEQPFYIVAFTCQVNRMLPDKMKSSAFTCYCVFIILFSPFDRLTCEGLVK